MDRDELAELRHEVAELRDLVRAQNTRLERLDAVTETMLTRVDRIVRGAVTAALTDEDAAGDHEAGVATTSTDAADEDGANTPLAEVRDLLHLIAAQVAGLDDRLSDRPTAASDTPAAPDAGQAAGEGPDGAGGTIGAAPRDIEIIRAQAIQDIADAITRATGGLSRRKRRKLQRALERADDQPTSDQPDDKAASDEPGHKAASDEPGSKAASDEPGDEAASDEPEGDKTEGDRASGDKTERDKTAGDKASGDGPAGGRRRRPRSAPAGEQRVVKLEREPGPGASSGAPSDASDAPSEPDA